MRADKRTKDLTKRLQPGDVAVIDHEDLDRVSAEALVACRPSVVINAAASITGRYPNVGPEILLDAGIPLIDGAGSGAFERLTEGAWVRVAAGEVFVGEERIAAGTVQTIERVARDMVSAREGLSVQLEAFAKNTMDYLVQEKDLLLDGVGVPDITTKLDGRHALIVVRGYNYKEDLRALDHYMREFKPILIGVDGGADALLELGRKPHLIVGDMDSVSDAALRCGAEIVVHAYRDGCAPLVEFLDKGRAGMASTFLTRLRVGSKLIDAKGVSRLYRSRISTRTMVVMLTIGLLVLGLALSATPGGSVLLQLLGARWDDIWAELVGTFT